MVEGQATRFIPEIRDEGYAEYGRIKNAILDRKDLIIALEIKIMRRQFNDKKERAKLLADLNSTLIGLYQELRVKVLKRKHIAGFAKLLILDDVILGEKPQPTFEDAMEYFGLLQQIIEDLGITKIEVNRTYGFKKVQ